MVGILAEIQGSHLGIISIAWATMSVGEFVVGNVHGTTSRTGASTMMLLKHRHTRSRDHIGTKASFGNNDSWCLSG